MPLKKASPPIGRISSEHAEAGPLIEFLEKYNLPPRHIDAIQSAFTPLQLGKGEKFSEFGKVCTRIGILMNGLLFAAYDKENSAKEIISRFFYSPSQIFVTSFESFSKASKSNEHITAIEPSFLFCIDRKDLEGIYNSFPETNLIGRLIAEQSYIQALQRAHALQALNAEERLADFFRVHPHLFNRVQRQHITSYLGINRNALSEHMNRRTR